MASCGDLELNSDLRCAASVGSRRDGRVGGAPNPRSGTELHLAPVVSRQGCLEAGQPGPAQLVPDSEQRQKSVREKQRRVILHMFNANFQRNLLVI